MGFKVTRDYIKDKNEKGAIGNHTIKPTGFNSMFLNEEQIKSYPYSGGKIKVRLKDDDGNIYYHGVVDDDDFSCELFLEWGMSDAGCTNLDLHMDDWNRLNNNREHPYISKDGKWVHYMG